MKHVSILIPQGKLIMTCITGTIEILDKVNQYMIRTGKAKEDFFQWQLVSTPKEKSYPSYRFLVEGDVLMDEVKETDLILIPALDGNLVELIELNQPVIDWVVKMHTRKNAEVGSFCSGAFLLAKTGLVDGRSCTTHWTGEALFRELFPKVDLKPENIITDENGIYTSGGAYSFLNLLLYMIEKFCGKEVAVWAAKVFEIEYARVNQNVFSIFNLQKLHRDKEISQAQEILENRFAGDVSIEAIAKEVAISRRNFIRRFKKATGNTPIEYLQRVRIEAAKKILESSRENVNDAMYQVGYNDVKTFRKIFKKYTGLTPAEYRQRYNQRYLQVA